MLVDQHANLLSASFNIRPSMISGPLALFTFMVFNWSTTTQIELQLKTINVNKAEGPDGIPGRNRTPIEDHKCE